LIEVLFLFFSPKEIQAKFAFLCNGMEELVLPLDGKSPQMTHFFSIYIHDNVYGDIRIIIIGITLIKLSRIELIQNILSFNS